MPVYEPYDQVTKEEVLRWANRLDHNRKRLEFHIGLRTWEQTGDPAVAAMENASEALRAYANLWMSGNEMQHSLPGIEMQAPVEVARLWAHDLTELYAGTEYVFLLDKLVEIGLRLHQAPSSLQTPQQRRQRLARALRKQGWFKRHQTIKNEVGYFWYPPSDIEPDIKDTQDYDATAGLLERQRRIDAGQIA